MPVDIKVQIIPEDRQQGTVGYFIGNVPAKWRTSDEICRSCNQK
ncbi:MAG: hypothetical protein ACLQBD_07095 [Syntrophobacteraceae bacterium]